MSHIPTQIQIVKKEVPAMTKGFDLMKTYVIWEMLEPWKRNTCDDWREVLQSILKDA